MRKLGLSLVVLALLATGATTVLYLVPVERWIGAGSLRVVGDHGLHPLDLPVLGLVALGVVACWRERNGPPGRIGLATAVGCTLAVTVVAVFGYRPPSHAPGSGLVADLGPDRLLRLHVGDLSLLALALSGLVGCALVNATRTGRRR